MTNESNLLDRGVYIIEIWDLIIALRLGSGW